MKKVEYHGGGTLVGEGKITKARGRKGGIGDTASAAREKKKIRQADDKKKLSEITEKNQKLIRKMAKNWSDEKGKRIFADLKLQKRATQFSLAAALLKILDRSK